MTPEGHRPKGRACYELTLDLWLGACMCASKVPLMLLTQEGRSKKIRLIL